MKLCSLQQKDFHLENASISYQWNIYFEANIFIFKTNWLFKDLPYIDFK